MSKKSKSKSTTDPSPYAKSYITPAADAVRDQYNQAQPGIDQFRSTINAGLPGVAQNAFGTSPQLEAAMGYNTDVIGGKYLDAGNPYLQGIINQTGDSVGNRVNSTFGAAGRTGSGQHMGLLTRELANSENNLRYTDYGNERARMAQAQGLVPGLEQARYSGIAPLLALGQGTLLGQQSAGQLASGTGGLLGQYVNKTGTETTPIGIGTIFDAIGKGASAVGALGLSDRRLKTDIERVGTHKTGVGIYEFNYIWPGQRQRGVMADEVAELAPWALGEPINGFATVDYSRLHSELEVL